MNSPLSDLSYFSLRLQELLQISFPEKASDQSFIEQRALWAAETYERAFRLGDSIEICNESADHVLFKDLHFSKFDTVLQVVSNEFASSMFDEKLKPFAYRMLSVCENVFTNYNFNDHFAYSEEYQLLYIELRNKIAFWVEEN